MKRLLIKNGLLILPGREVKGDLLVENGKIAGVFESGCAAPEECEVVDAAGKIVLPGLVDTHVHMQDPGPMNYREDWYTGSCSAASGGITTIVDMPLSIPAVTDRAGFENKKKCAEEKSVVDFAFWGGFTPNCLENMEELDKLGCVAYKGYMCLCAKEYPQITDGYLVEGMRKAAKFGGLIGLHAENAEAAGFGVDHMDAAGCTDEAMFDEARPWWTEYEAVQRALLFAKVTGARLMICHNTITQGVELLKQAKREGQEVYVESCPHYLIFDKNVLREKKSFAKCTPPFRSRENVEKMWDYVKDGTIDVIGSDHGPFTDAEKVQNGNFWKEYCGFGCNDAILPAMITEGVHKRGVSWARLAQIMSENAARMFRIFPRKGSLLPGADADIVIVDPEAEWTYDGTKSFSKTKSDKGVYHGYPFRGKVVSTYVRGRRVYDNGKITADAGWGGFVPKGRE